MITLVGISVGNIPFHRHLISTSFFSPPFSLELFDDVLGLNNVGKVCFETKLLISIITCTSQECEFPFMC